MGPASCGDGETLRRTWCTLPATVFQQPAEAGFAPPRFVARRGGLPGGVEGGEVSSQLSVAQILANLETQIAEHREKEAFHAQQEVLHREQRAVHAGEFEAMIRHYEAFKVTAEAAAEIAARVAPPAPPPPPKEEPLPAKALRSKLVARVVMS